MSNLVDLVRRTERLRSQMELVRRELEGLQEDLLRLDRQAAGPQSTPAPATADCLAAAMALSQDLGPGFSSDQPHELADRGNDWFVAP